jgi:hypothetical protein
VAVQVHTAPSLRRVETRGAVAVIVGGAALHFAYALSGDNPLVALVAPVNESVWEHLKLVLFPVLVLGVVEARWVTDRRRLWWAKLVEVLAASAFIVGFFYGYTGALGVESNVAVDILSFVVAIAAGQWLSYRILLARGRIPPVAASLGTLLVLVVAVGVVTFQPPHLPVFQDSTTGEYGAR